jgi:hypothetical protein
MRKLLTTTILLLVVVLAAPMWAQTTSDVYQLHPFFDGNLDRVLIVNSGQTGTPISSDEGVLCADIYVFDANQEMSECCGCAVTADGTLNLNSADLRDNPLTGITPTNGTIKIVSSALTGKKCDPTNPVPTPDLRAYMWANGYSRFAAAPLQAGEQGFLGQACAFVLYLGSSKGQCRCSID